MSTNQTNLTQDINSVLVQLTSDIQNNRLQTPSPPSLLVKLRTIAKNENSNAQDMADVIKLDPNISGRVIKVANSVLFGGRTPVSTSQAAIARLGFKKVHSLVISLLIAQNFISNKIKGLDPDQSPLKT